MQPTAFGHLGVRDDGLQQAVLLVALYSGLGFSRAQAHLVVPYGGEFRRNLPSLCDLGFAYLVDGERERLLK